MPSQHADRKVLAVRPPEEDLAAAKNVLGEHGWDLRGFITACLRELIADPVATLRRLAPRRPDPKPLGRPKRTD